MSDKRATKQAIKSISKEATALLSQLAAVVENAGTFDLELLALAADTHRKVSLAVDEIDDGIMRRVDVLRRDGVTLDELADALKVHRNTVIRRWQKLESEPLDSSKRQLRQHRVLLDGLRVWKRLEAAAAKAERREPFATPRVEEVIELNGEPFTLGRRLYVQKRAASNGKIDPDLAAALSEMLGCDWAETRRTLG